MFEKIFVASKLLKYRFYTLKMQDITFKDVLMHIDTF